MDLKRSFPIIVALLLVALLVLLLASCSTSSISQSPTQTPEPSGMVDVGGYSLFYQCFGEGTPTVILESGQGTDSSCWTTVVKDTWHTTQICIYDRANLGRSDKVSGPRTFQDMTRDLQVLLENAHIGGPYILVGWSLGGDLVRIFAGEHPGDVGGIVLVDSAHPDTGDRLLACLPPESTSEPENIQILRQVFGWMAGLNELPSPEVEKLDNRVSIQQVHEVRTLGDLPLVVISQAPNIPGLGFQWITSLGRLPVEIDTCLQQTWQDMQGELAGLSSNTTRLTARGGHMIPVEQSELITQAIIDLVNQYR